MAENLMDGLLSELNRNRELLQEYEAIPTGVFGAHFIKQAIKKGEQSISSGNVIDMLLAYEELKETK